MEAELLRQSCGDLAEVELLLGLSSSGAAVEAGLLRTTCKDLAEVELL